MEKNIGFVVEIKITPLGSMGIVSQATILKQIYS